MPAVQTQVESDPPLWGEEVADLPITSIRRDLAPFGEQLHEEAFCALLDLLYESLGRLLAPVLVYQTGAGDNVLLAGEAALDRALAAGLAGIRARRYRAEDMQTALTSLVGRLAGVAEKGLARAWAITLLQDMLLERGQPASNRDLQELLNLGSSAVSESIELGRAITPAVARRVCAKQGIPVRALNTVSRDMWRKVVKEVDPQVREDLVATAAEAIRQRRKPARAIAERLAERRVLDLAVSDRKIRILVDHPLMMQPQERGDVITALEDALRLLGGEWASRESPVTKLLPHLRSILITVRDAAVKIIRRVGGPFRRP
jgi:hypothetical protein